MQSEKFQLQSMSNAMRCIDQRFAYKSSGISCLALIFNLARYDKLYTIFCERSIQTHGSVVKALSMESGDLE